MARRPSLSVVTRARRLDGRALLTAPATVDDHRCYAVGLHTPCTHVQTTDSSRPVLTTPGDDGVRGRAVNSRRRPSPVDHTQRPALCTVRRAIGRNGVGPCPSALADTCLPGSRRIEERVVLVVTRSSKLSCTWQLYSGGVYASSDCTTSINHGVLIVGYGTHRTFKGDLPYWIIKNR